MMITCRWKPKLLLINQRLVWKAGAEHVEAQGSPEDADAISETDKVQKKAEGQEEIILEKIKEFYGLKEIKESYDLKHKGVRESPEALRIKQETMKHVFEYCVANIDDVVAKEVFNPIYEKFWEHVDIPTDVAMSSPKDTGDLQDTGSTPTIVGSD